MCVFVWRRENECVFVLLCAWQCPQWCHPECVSSSSAMTKMSNDTHIHSHPHTPTHRPICAMVSGCFGTLQERKRGKRPHVPAPCVYLSPLLFYSLLLSFSIFFLNNKTPQVTLTNSFLGQSNYFSEQKAFLFIGFYNRGFSWDKNCLFKRLSSSTLPSMLTLI